MKAVITDADSRDPSGLANEHLDEGSPIAPVSLYAQLKVKVEQFNANCILVAQVFGNGFRARLDV